MSAYHDDQDMHEAIGWLASAAGGPLIARQVHLASRAGLPDIAAHLLRWADLTASSLTSIEWADRRRHYADFDAVQESELA